MYYEARAVFQEEMPNGNIKEKAEKILITAIDIKQAREKAEKWFAEDSRAHKITHVKETTYSAVID